MNDLYNILGVSRNATLVDIQKAFRKKAKEYHPDRGGNASEFVKIQKAYKILSDPVKREEYDDKDSVEFVQDPLEYARTLWANIF